MTHIVTSPAPIAALRKVHSITPLAIGERVSGVTASAPVMAQLPSGFEIVFGAHVIAFFEKRLASPPIGLSEPR
jgi:hypothetical protein